MDTNSKLQERLNQIKSQNAEVSAPSQKLMSEDDIAVMASSILKEPETVESADTVNENEIVHTGRTVEVTVEHEAEQAKTPMVGDDLFDGIEAIKKDSEAISDELKKTTVEVTVESDENDNNAEHAYLTDEEQIDAIINDLDDSPKKRAEREEKDLDQILDEIEEKKKFVDIPQNEYDSGPAAYVVLNDESYASQVTEILDTNGIKFTKPTDKEKNALLETFINSGTKVCVALPNSGIYVEFSGAGVDELVGMSSVQTEDPMQDELTRLIHLSKHITNSSVGPLKLQQLLNIVSFYDTNTLYYGLFAATHPDIIEVSRQCGNPRCGEMYYSKIRTRDLLLNYSEYKKSELDIRDNVTTYNRLLEKSQLGKVYVQKHSNGMIIYYKHPSLKSYLATYKNLEPETVALYENISHFAFCIEKIAIPDIRKNGNNSQYVEYENPNDIIKLIASLKNPNEKYEIADIVMKIIPEEVPIYGHHKSVCPHCGWVNQQEEISISSLLFTFARDENWWAKQRQFAAQAKKKKQKQTNE